MIHNARARHNLARQLPQVIPGCDQVAPASHAELRGVLAGFVDAAIDTLIVDGGDGTVRDILSAIGRDFPDFHPRFAIVPSGKTNALALDVGTPRSWTLPEAIEAAVHGREEARPPIEVWRTDAERADARGFIFGAGAFVRATRTAQKTHRAGAFNGLAVGLTIAAGVAQTVFGGRNNAWRRGERMAIAVGSDQPVDGPNYFLLASTLKRLPLGIRPLGPVRAGLKLLRIEAPARRLAAAAPIILAGRFPSWLGDLGYHQADAARVDLSLAGDFVLDGEAFAGGELSLRQGAPVTFVVP